MFSLHIDTARTWRGGQNQVLLTVLGLRAAGERAVLVAHPEGELRRRAADGLDLVPLAPAGEVDLAAAWRLSRVLRQLRPEVVHAHDPHGVAMAAVALSIATPTPAPRLVAARRVDFHVKGNSFSRWKYRQVDTFIASSDAIRTMLVRDGIPADRVVTVHEGVDVDRIARLPALSVHAELWLPAHAPIVGNIAALVPHKGQKHLVDAAALVVGRVPDARFVIFGEGELRPVLERRVRELHLDKHVFLPGFRADVLALLKSVDVFVMSSVTEGLGTSVLDAMAASKPVIATRAGGLPEIVREGETGLLVPPGDHHALATAIERLIGDAPLRARMGEAGFARVREGFSVERMVADTLGVYHRTADRAPAADSAHPPGRG